MTPDEAKIQARAEAMARRKAAFDAAAGTDPSERLARELERYRGRPLSGYAAMRTEADPTGAMVAAAAFGPVGLPIIVAPATPLRFRLWTPGGPMAPGTFGAKVPVGGDWMVPEVLIVPLLAFDRRGGRLGYGGGFYDRTLEELRRGAPVVAIGFAFAGQEAAHIPLEPTDQQLDMIVTERETIRPGP